MPKNKTAQTEGASRHPIVGRDHADPKEDRILWQVDLARRFGFDRVTVYRWCIEGKLPRPDVVFGRRRGWYLSHIIAWEAASRESCAGAAQ